MKITAANSTRPPRHLPMKITATIALSFGAFAITTVVAYIMVWGWMLLLLILSGHVSGFEIPTALRYSVCIVYNVAIAAIVVLLPVWIAVWGARRFGVVSSIVSLLITAVLMGATAAPFLQQLTTVNTCMAGVEFPNSNYHGICSSHWS